MSDHTARENRSRSKSRAEGETAGAKVVTPRRRFLKGGIAATPAIITLTSRPAFGALKACTTSAINSWNPSVELECPCGDTPGWYKNKPNPDDWCASGGLASGYIKVKGTISEDPNNDSTLLSDIPVLYGSPLCLSGADGSFAGSISMYTIFTDETYSPTLLRHVLAALLNACKDPGGFGSAVTPQYILDIYCQYQNGQLERWEAMNLFLVLECEEPEFET